MANERRAHLSPMPLRLAAMLLSIVSAAHLCHAQASAVTRELRTNTVDVLTGFEPAAGQEYELGSGDEISIDVLGRPELSGKHIIGPDGRITLPVAGDLELAGRTRSQAAKDIHALLGAYYQDISVSLSVDRYTSNRILLFGAVEHPGLMVFDGTPTLLEVISRGGVSLPPTQIAPGASSPAPASPPAVIMPEVCMIYRGGQTVVTLQLRSLLQSGDPSANMRLKRDDVVFVPGEHAYVSVLGSVLRPGLLRLESTSTLPELLAQSGGFSEKGGHYPQIFVIHPGTGSAGGSVETVLFKDVLQSKPLHLTVRPGDVIYVAESGFNHFADVIQKVSPLINLITVGALLGQ